MGDTKRFTVTAGFVHRNYQNRKLILDVAGGKGLLRDELEKFGHKVRTVDPNGKDIRKYFTLDLLAELEEGLGRFDLIVGLHPDGATKDICMAARTHDIVVVPCCNMWGKGNINDLIENYLRYQGIDFRSTTLNMKGKNAVYFTHNYRPSHLYTTAQPSVL